MSEIQYYQTVLQEKEMEETEPFYEKNHRILNEFDNLRPIIKGENNGRDIQQTKTPF